MGYRAIITIVRTYDNRTAADTGVDSIINKVPSKWEIREESVSKV